MAKLEPPASMSESTAPLARGLPFSVWLFVRLIVPTGPILIQYGLAALGLYAPPFPQPAFVILLFSLALVTVTEYTDLPGVIYGCVMPAISASVLYTVYIVKIDEPVAHHQALLAGFYLWAVLLCINVTRAAMDGVRHYFEVPKR